MMLKRMRCCNMISV